MYLLLQLETDLEIKPLGKFNIDEQKSLSFKVEITDSSVNDVQFSLSGAPSGAKINSDTGSFSWIPILHKEQEVIPLM